LILVVGPAGSYAHARSSREQKSRPFGPEKQCPGPPEGHDDATCTDTLEQKAFVAHRVQFPCSYLLLPPSSLIGFLWTPYQPSRISAASNPVEQLLDVLGPG